MYHMQKTLSKCFSKLHFLQSSTTQNTNTSANVPDITAMLELKFPFFWNVNTMFLGRNVRPSSSGSRSPRTAMYDIRVETGHISGESVGVVVICTGSGRGTGPMTRYLESLAARLSYLSPQYSGYCKHLMHFSWNHCLQRPHCSICMNHSPSFPQ